MSTIFSKNANLTIIPVVLANGNIQEALILPDFNFDFDPKLVDALTRHPIFVSLVEKGIFTVTETEPDVVGQKDGFDLTDSKEFGEELLITKQSDIDMTPSKYLPTKEALTAYKGVGNKTADAMLKLAPEGGWATKEAFVESVKEFGIDWSSK